MAGNVAAAAPETILTEAGTLNKPLLLASETSAPTAGAAFESVTLQVALAPVARLTGTHERELTTVEVTSEMLAIVEPPL